MSTVQEQIDLLEAEKVVANDMIIEKNDQVASLKIAIESQNNLIDAYNKQIIECNDFILRLNDSNQVRDDIINELVNNSGSLFKKKKEKKK